MARIILAAWLALLTLPFVHAAADTLEAIKESGELRIGFRDDAPPFSFKTDTGDPAGYTIELCRAVADGIQQTLGLAELKITYIPVSTSDRFEAVIEGRIDMLCGATTATLSRREMVDFSIPIFITGASALMRIDGPENFEALAGQKVGVRADTTTQDLLQNIKEAQNLDVEIIPVASHQYGLKLLEDGEIAAYFGDRAILVFLRVSSDHAADFRVLNQLFSYEPYALAISRGDTDFRLVVDRLLSQIYRSPVIRTIFRSSFGEAQPGQLLSAMFLIGALPE